ncbi:endonuclease domain-containing protein [Aquimarina litoralis]|uniref:endonuclease domain-containing protein n=1 Tax=Aquimarina litoralis TaxID=584605 RepID=UPI001FE4D2CC|nr:endonuclease domain-containing protein [Aquimarina litoralis]
MKQLHNRKYLESFRKNLRNNGTSAEAFLWKYLQKSQIQGRKFRRQHSIGNYIVDFYCPKEKMIIELDGEIHNQAKKQEYDQKRTKYLEGLGFAVIRFENKMVFESLPSVLKEIEDNFADNNEK